MTDFVLSQFLAVRFAKELPAISHPYFVNGGQIKDWLFFAADMEPFIERHGRGCDKEV